MRWTTNKEWQRWFAWYPVQCRDGVTAWLEIVVRIRMLSPVRGGKGSWGYKTPEQYADDLLSEIGKGERGPSNGDSAQAAGFLAGPQGFAGLTRDYPVLRHTAPSKRSA